jgi:transcriptional regulator with XRE-family HTH domain
MEVAVVSKFGTLLREERRRNKQTLGNVARQLEISIPYVSDVERGNRAPFAPERIIVLAEFLNTDAGALLVAAAESRGAFELDAKQSRMHQEVGAALMRGWTDLSEEDLESIAGILQKRKGSP